MSGQLALLDTPTIAKSIVTVGLDRLRHSPFNPRTTRPASDLQILADRIARNGFEVTRALWVYPAGDHYEVFAGSRRFEAARLAGLSEVPVVLHTGYNDGAIIRMAETDNENDEYHQVVPLVDVWHSYKALADRGWTQQQIADAKGVSQQTAQRRLAFADFPQSVLDRFTPNALLAEGHAREFDTLPQWGNLSAWLTRETSMCEVIDAVCGKVAKDKAPTAKQFASAVADYNAFLTLANDMYVKLPAPYNAAFVDLLAQNKARGTAAVQVAYNTITARKLAGDRAASDSLAAQVSAAEAARVAAEQEQRQSALIVATLAKLVHANAYDVEFPTAIDLLLTDPPYGMAYQSNRRTATSKADKIANDDSAAFSLLAGMLPTLYECMAADSHVLMWSGWRYEPRFRELLETAGFEIRGSLIWNKSNHGTGDLVGSFAPKHERIIHAVKGNPKLRERLSDVLAGNEFLGTEHPTEKPIDLLRALIAATTDPGALVVDPFAGVGSTLVAAHDTGRDFFGVELDAAYHRIGSDILHRRISQ